MKSASIKTDLKQSTGVTLAQELYVLLREEEIDVLQKHIEVLKKCLNQPHLRSLQTKPGSKDRKSHCLINRKRSCISRLKNQIRNEKNGNRRSFLAKVAGNSF